MKIIKVYLDEQECDVIRDNIDTVTWNEGGISIEIINQSENKDLQ